MNRIIILSVLLFNLVSMAQSRLEILECKSLDNKINFSANLKTKFENGKSSIESFFIDLNLDGTFDIKGNKYFKDRSGEALKLSGKTEPVDFGFYNYTRGMESFGTTDSFKVGDLKYQARNLNFVGKFVQLIVPVTRKDLDTKNGIIISKAVVNFIIPAFKNGKTYSVIAKVNVGSSLEDLEAMHDDRIKVIPVGYTFVQLGEIDLDCTYVRKE